MINKAIEDEKNVTLEVPIKDECFFTPKDNKYIQELLKINKAITNQEPKLTADYGA